MGIEGMRKAERSTWNIALNLFPFFSLFAESTKRSVDQALSSLLV